MTPGSVSIQAAGQVRIGGVVIASDRVVAEDDDDD
jgi:hypothetical protein